MPTVTKTVCAMNAEIAKTLLQEDMLAPKRSGGKQKQGISK